MDYYASGQGPAGPGGLQGPNGAVNYTGPVSQSQSQTLTNNGIANAGSPDARTGAQAPPAQNQLSWQALTAPNLSSINPNLDASYQSYLRGMGLNQAQIQAQSARQKSYLDQQLADQRPLWADQLRTGLQNISDSAENRGLFRSGERLQDQNNFQNNQAEQQTAAENSIHRQQQELGATAQDQLMSLAQNRAEQELAARQRIAMSQVQSQINPSLLEFLSKAIPTTNTGL